MYKFAKVQTFLIIALIVLMSLFMGGCTQHDNEVYDFRINCSCIQEDKSAGRYMDVVKMFDEALHGDADIVSSLSFNNGVYTYIDENNENERLVEVPLSDMLVKWWNGYGFKEKRYDFFADFDRPVPDIQFDGTQFDMVTMAVPANATQEELETVMKEDRREVNLPIVYEFLLRTYGIQQEQVVDVFIEDTCKDIQSNLFNGLVSVRVVYLWFVTTDGTVNKLDAMYEDCFVADADCEERYYIGIWSDDHTGSYKVGPMMGFDWPNNKG